jgi:hypothetical protein
VTRRPDLPQPLRALRVAFLGATLASLALGFLVLLGWLSGAPGLTQGRPGVVPMRFNTALSFVCLCAALLVGERPKGRRAAVGLALVPAVLGLLTVAEYALPVPFSVDEILVRDWSGSSGTRPGRMAPRSSRPAVHRWPVMPSGSGSSTS